MHHCPASDASTLHRLKHVLVQRLDASTSLQIPPLVFRSDTQRALILDMPGSSWSSWTSLDISVSLSTCPPISWTLDPDNVALDTSLHSGDVLLELVHVGLNSLDGRRLGYVA
jgi:hypothetical protein